MTLTTNRQREELRQSFRPRRVQLLFIGESPPVSGRFFYSANTGLYRAMRAAFQIADPSITEVNFLAAFRSRGCFLTDVSHDPVNHLDASARKAKVNAGEIKLSREITLLQPAIIAPMLLSIAPVIDKAIARAKWWGEMCKFPYPGRWLHHQQEFIQTLVPVIQRLRIGEP